MTSIWRRAWATVTGRQPRRAGERPPLGVAGVSGLRAGGGQVAEEWRPELVGERGRTTYRRMASDDPVVGAALLAFELLLRQAPWSVEPADDSEVARAEAAFVDSCLFAGGGDLERSWDEVFSDILSMLPYGWAYLEILWKLRRGASDDPTERSKYDDGRVGIRNLSLRSQHSLDRWEIDGTGALRGMHQLGPAGQRRFIPSEKALVFRVSSRGDSPEGRSLLRNAVVAWDRKTKIEVLEAIGIERDLVGIPVAWVPADLTLAAPGTAQHALYQRWKETVSRVRRDEQEGLVLPLEYDEQGHKLYDFTLLGPGGQRQYDTDRIIARYDSRILLSMLAGFLLLGHEKTGSFALSSDQTDLFALACDAVLDGIEDVLNAHLVPRLYRLNGLDPGRAARIRHGDVETPDLAKLGDFIQTLAGAGMPLFPDETLENHLRALADLPPRPESLGVETDQRPDERLGAE